MKGTWWRLDSQRFVSDPAITVTSIGRYQWVPDAENEVIDAVEKFDDFSEDDDEFEDIEKEPSSNAFNEHDMSSGARSLGEPRRLQTHSPASMEAALGEELRQRLLEVQPPGGQGKAHDRNKRRSSSSAPPCAGDSTRSAERVLSARERGLVVLEVEFLQPKWQQDKVLRCIFSKRPVGIVFDESELPLTVATVSGGSAAHVQGVRKGMQLMTINGKDVTKSSMRTYDVQRLFKDHYALLPNESQSRSVARRVTPL
jgi:hypothetical protein